MNGEDIGPFLLIVVMALFVGGAIIGARRFAKRRQREGLWDEKGPKDPSLPPPDFLRVHPQPWGISRPEIETEDDDDLDEPHH
ncbi:MAG TPA: hypothetical protein VGQ30_12585 [Gemmatimonadaceae bacterium]|nr:hypothetical protein [Gemmatimonadaceae bacterium]